MNLNPSHRNWVFPIEKTRIFAIVTRTGEARNVTMPHKKALAPAAAVRSSQTAPSH
jgi:hypothetical protein